MQRTSRYLAAVAGTIAAILRAAAVYQKTFLSVRPLVSNNEIILLKIDCLAVTAVKDTGLLELVFKKRSGTSQQHHVYGMNYRESPAGH